VTGALLSGESYRPAPLQIDTTPPAGGERRAPRSPHARTRTTDRLVPAPAAAPAAVPDDAPPSVAAAPPAAAKASVDDVAAALRQAGEGGRRVAVIGAARNVGTTLTAIALARTLARSARVVLVDLALASPNIDVISDDPAAPGLADLVRGAASFGDIITRDRFSRLHLVAAGRVEGDPSELWSSHMLSAAVGALAQSYDMLLIDAGAQSEVALESILPLAPRLVLVGGETSPRSLAALADQMRSAGFAEVTVLTGPPPALDHAVTQTAAA
jgi:Mrp family chromosome partitioning ATPase